MIREDMVKMLSPHMEEINMESVRGAFEMIDDLKFFSTSRFEWESVGDEIELNSKNNIVELGVMRVANCKDGTCSFIMDLVFLGICFSSNNGELEWFHHHGYDPDVRSDIYAIPEEDRITTIIPMTPQGCIDELNHLKEEEWVSEYDIKSIDNLLEEITWMVEG